MAKLYTRTGDDGGSSLFDGRRVRKDDPRLAAYGEIDELNAHMGCATAEIRVAHRDGRGQTLAERLAQIQGERFIVGAELATPADAAESRQIRVPRISTAEVFRLEQWIDDASATTAPLKNFILPGGSIAAAHLHVCRTVCRRAERTVVTLSAAAAINPQIVIYLNRLSDLLFAWARHANQLDGVAEVPWNAP